jgi:hypothetical protein
VGRAGGPSDGDPRRIAGAATEGEYPAGHILLATEQVRDAGKVEEQAVGSREHRARRPAAGGEKGKPGQHR